MEATKLTPEQQQYLNDMANYGKRLEQLAVASVGKYVAAGYANNIQKVAKMYCYCGTGKGYEGVCVVPANGNAVVFTSKAAAEQVANQLYCENGKGERITFSVMPANEYFWLLYDNLCVTLKEAERLMRINIKNRNGQK
ncbi:MAG: hypothetical protein NC548_56220 [Lachnospiraceae bacterium]|nr:hypothetical protein [Lachnospiraceae bacterium]